MWIVTILEELEEVYKLPPYHHLHPLHYNFQAPALLVDRAYRVLKHKKKNEYLEGNQIQIILFYLLLINQK